MFGYLKLLEIDFIESRLIRFSFMALFAIIKLSRWFHVSQLSKIEAQTMRIDLTIIINKEGNVGMHYDDVIMAAIASQITSLTIVYSTVYSDADQRKHQSSASLAFVRGIHRRPVNSPHKWPVTRKMFPFDDVIMAFQKTDWHFYVILESTWN